MASRAERIPAPSESRPGAVIVDGSGQQVAGFGLLAGPYQVVSEQDGVGQKRPGAERGLTTKICYFGRMKSKISVTLSPDVVSYLDRIAGRGGNRSRLVEKALRDYMTRQKREARDRRDLEILNDNARSLNEEAEEVLSYQVKV